MGGSVEAAGHAGFGAMSLGFTLLYDLVPISDLPLLQKNTQDLRSAPVFGGSLKKKNYR